MINAAVQRYDRSRPTDELFDRYYEPSGELTIPMISQHNMFDPVVPMFHEDLYEAKVSAMGCSHNLEQRVINRYAHTDFPAEEAAEEGGAATPATPATPPPTPPAKTKPSTSFAAVTLTVAAASLARAGS